MKPPIPLRLPYYSHILTVFVFCITLSGCSSALMVDVTPPPDFKPTWQAPSGENPVEEVSPLLPPDLTSGREVYDNNCVSCHGPDGMGSGEQTGNLPAEPVQLGAISYSKSISPAAWYQVVTRGRIDRLMPGFKDELSDRQRWDVVAYVMTLDTTSEQLESGRQVFNRTCQTCHGAGGKGEEGPDLTSTRILQFSVDDLMSIMENGKGSMPAAGRSTSETERLNTAQYLRSLIFVSSPGGLPDVQPTTSVDQDDASSNELIGNNEQVISGLILNGSGGEVPKDLRVTVQAYDLSGEVYKDQQTISVDGKYSFSHVPASPEIIVIVSTVYKDIYYSTDVLHANQEPDRSDFNLTIYDTATDISAITAERMHIFFRFPNAGTLRIVQLYIINNPTNNLVVSSGSGIPLIKYPLPAGATNLQFENGSLGDRFVRTEDGFGDTAGLIPGSNNQVLFTYDLPYKPELLFFIKVPFPVMSANIMLPAGEVSVKSSQLQDLGNRLIQDTTWQMFTSGRLEAGSRIDLLVSGKPEIEDPLSGELAANLAIGVVALVVSLLVLGSVIYQQLVKKRISLTIHTVKDAVDRDTILDAIIALDDQYKAGQIPQNAYLERRTELKNNLRGNES